MALTLAETTTLPTTGADAHLGAMGFLAALAYPQDISKRNQFVEAAKANLTKIYIARGMPRAVAKPQFRRYVNRTIKNKIRRCQHRIETRRLPAAMMARWILLHHPPLVRVVDPENPAWKPTTVNAAVTRMAILLRHADPRHLEPVAELANLSHLVWAESKPVLHLALALYEAIQTQGRDRGPLFDLVVDPGWLAPTLARAEALRRTLAYIPKLRSPAPICLLPTPGP